MKKIGVILLFVVLGLTTYLIFWSQFEATKIKLFATVGISIGIFFVLSERIISVKTFFWSLRLKLTKCVQMLRR